MIYSLGGDIFTVRIDGTDRKKIASAKTGGGGFQWAPDGKTIRFSASDGHPSVELWEMSRDGTGIHRLLPNWKQGTYQCCGRWTPDGNFYVFIADDQIWALDERHRLFTKTSSLPVQLTTGPMHWGAAIPSKDGTKVFAEGATLRGELTRIDPKTGNPQPFLGGISADDVSFSPDGNYVAYVSYPDGTLWRANRDGTNRIQLFHARSEYENVINAVINPRWSPNSKEILFATLRPDGSGEIHRISAEDGSPRWLLSKESAPSAGDPNWSSDGKKVVFDFDSGSLYGQPTQGDLRIVDLDAKQVTALPGSKGKWSPRWSPDGRYIAALSHPELGHLPIFDLKLQRWFDLRPNGEVDFPNFSHDSKFIYFLRFGQEQGVFRIPVAGGKEERVANLKGWHLTGNQGISLTLDPSDAPLIVRDIGSDDLYALTFAEK